MFDFDALNPAFTDQEPFLDLDFFANEDEPDEEDLELFDGDEPEDDDFDELLEYDDWNVYPETEF